MPRPYIQSFFYRHLACPTRSKQLFYSVNRNEKETATGADHLSGDLGIGEEVGGSGTARAKETMRSLRSVLCAAYGTANR
jgi:hypothetical protein